MPPTPPQNTKQPEGQHIIASPNPTIDDSKTNAAEPGEVTITKVQPTATKAAAPMKKKATRPKRTRKSSQ